jgi:IS4 transposase
MILNQVFEPFLQGSPLSVMARATIEHALSPDAVDQLFNQTAVDGYTKTLLFSTTLDLMSLVVCNSAKHVQGAFQKICDRVPVSLKSVYEKLQHIEPVVSTQLVRHVADRCQALLTELGGTCAPLLPGHRVRILDGNHLAATQKRLAATRGRQSGPLPGQSLAVLDPALMLITHVVLCEDAYTQERALLDQIEPLIAADDVWIEDRNFCTVDFLDAVAQRRAAFVVRRHANMTVESEVEYGPEVETTTGWASERPAWVYREGQRQYEVREVQVRLKQPTGDGDTEVYVLTNLSASTADAAKVAELYLKRWKIEGAFHELTMALKCEVKTLGYPKAALFAFSVAVAAYNILAVLKGALRAVHGEKKVQEEVSGYYMAMEWSGVYLGMMIAVPASEWTVFGTMSAGELAKYLREWAAKINLLKIKKAPPRKPTKKKSPRIEDKSPHLSTARLLEAAKVERAAKRRAKNPQ